MTNIMEVKGLKKRFKQMEAVKGIDFNVKKGALFAFLGANGAGKSTTIEILCTIQEKTSGHVIIDGHTLGTANANDAIRNRIGVVFQQNLLDDQLTVRENVWHRAKLYRLKREQLAKNYQFVSKALELQDIEHRKYGLLSGGQKRRADIARAIIHMPSILFLDEPTTGLDPKTRKLVWKAIEQLRTELNMTIFLTTHYMEEAVLADDIVIMKEGEIVVQGSPQFLKKHYAKDQLILYVKEGEEYRLEQLQIAYYKRGEAVIIPVQSTVDAIPILQQLQDCINSFEVMKGSLDDVFIEVNEGGKADVNELSAAQ